MTPFEFQVAFERELNTFYNALQKPTSDTTFYWLNQAVVKFVKTRYGGTNAKSAGFEQIQKRTEDLRTLVQMVNCSANSVSSNEYAILLPQDQMFHLGTRVGILPKDDNTGNKCWSKDDKGKYVIRYTDPIEVTVDTLDRALENSLSEHNLHYCQAKPLQLFRGNNAIFYTDGNYKVQECIVTYLKTPKAITLDQPFVNYTELPEHTHQEIVKLAVQMYLESTADQRYTSYSNEVNTME